MVLRLNGSMTDLEIAESQERHVEEAKREATAVAEARVKATLAMQAHDQKIADSQEAARLLEANATLKTQNELREKFLATPLTEIERVEMQGLESMAQDGHNPDRGNMLRLATLRVKAKIKAKKEK